MLAALSATVGVLAGWAERWLFDKVNAYNLLMGRVRNCMQQRQLFPTIVAVNFYDQGDLLRVVNDLNGVG